jgi:glycosyltransferase involved in cell wall biosynthesis
LWIYSKATDPEDIARIMDHFYLLREQIIKMGKNGYNSFVENYNWVALKPKLLKVYKAL